MLRPLRNLLARAIEDIDAGNSDMTEEEELEIAEMLNKILRKDKPMSKYQAYTYLNISRAKFDNLVREGKLPRGQKREGFKELIWFKKDLNKYLKDGQ